MQPLAKTLSKQAARTVASRTIRTVAKQHVPTNSLIYKVGVSALIAAVGHVITKGVQSATTQQPLLEDGFDTPPQEIELSEKEITNILHQRMLSQKSK